MENRPSMIRLMCSHGGIIVTSPNDNILRYVGGDNRIVNINRHASLSDLYYSSFVLKYKLPGENLDTLISITTNEDLEYMINEHDRIERNNAPFRLRVFLFPLKPQRISLNWNSSEDSICNSEYDIDGENSSNGNNSDGENDSISNISRNTASTRLRSLAKSSDVASIGSGATKSDNDWYFNRFSTITTVPISWSGVWEKPTIATRRCTLGKAGLVALAGKGPIGHKKVNQLRLSIADDLQLERSISCLFLRSHAQLVKLGFSFSFEHLGLKKSIRYQDHIYFKKKISNNN